MLSHKYYFTFHFFFLGYAVAGNQKKVRNFTSSNFKPIYQQTIQKIDFKSRHRNKKMFHRFCFISFRLSLRRSSHFSVITKMYFTNKNVIFITCGYIDTILIFYAIFLSRIILCIISQKCISIILNSQYCEFPLAFFSTNITAYTKMKRKNIYIN